MVAQDGTDDSRAWSPETLTDFEAYCYLKSVLKPPMRVVAEPSTSYFSEWSYCYRVYHGRDEIAVFRGDFRNLRPGALAEEMARLVNNSI